jgi:hypothetical protein
MVERLVQSDSKAATGTLNDLDLSKHIRRDSASSRSRSVNDVVFGDEVKGAYSSTNSPLSIMLDKKMVRYILMPHVLAKQIFLPVEM